MSARNKTLFGIGALVLAALLSNAMVAAEKEVAKEGFVLEKEPKNAKGVIKIRKEAKNGDEVVVVGRIGGRTNPWVKGVAAFTIVDEAVKSCDQIPGDSCPTPWDYCCEAGLPEKTVFVSFVDDAGRIVKKDARKLLKIRELQTVVINGKVKRDKANNVSIQASSLYVRPDKRAAK